MSVRVKGAGVATPIKETEPWFMKLFSETMLVSLCILLLIGMIAATVYAFANSSADGSPLAIGTVPIESSPSSAQALGAPVPYSYVGLPLVECATTFANPDESRLTMPATIEEDVPSSLAGALTVYTDGLGDIKLLGPKAWTCSASIFGDGSSTVDVFPASERNVVSDEFASPLGNLPQGSPDREVYARQTSACVSCAETQACPVFTSAAVDLAADTSWSCPTEAPTNETVKSLTSTAVEIIDPPGVVGNAYPSGGVNDAYAIMTYRDDVNGSWEDSCLLPAKEVSLCLASLNNFFAGYGTN
jgi:hypothetical protein